MIIMKQVHDHIWSIWSKDHVHIYVIMAIWSVLRTIKYDQHRVRSCTYLTYHIQFWATWGNSISRFMPSCPHPYHHVQIWSVWSNILSTSALSYPYDQHDTRSYPHLCHHVHILSIWSKIMSACDQYYVRSCAYLCYHVQIWSP